MDQLVILHLDVGVKDLSAEEQDHFLRAGSEISFDVPGYIIKTLVTPNRNINRIRVRCVYPSSFTSVPDAGLEELVKNLAKEIDVK